MNIAFAPEGYSSERHRAAEIHAHGVDPDDPAAFARHVGEGWTDWIRPLDPDRVPVDVAELVGVTQWGVSEVLGLPFVPTACFFQPCAADHPDAVGPLRPLRGVVMPGRPREFYLRAGMSLLETERTTAHEIRHVWQALNGYTSASHSSADLERDAYAFDATWMEGTR